jgi:hypothetical protein
MSLAMVDSLRWPARRWWVALALVFGAQVGLIFWLGERKFPTPRTAAAATVLSLPERSSPELLGLNDPTLFALPQRLGFSGVAWLKPPPVPFQPDQWTEPPRYLALSVQQLGGGSSGTNLVPQSFVPRLPARPEPELISPITGSLNFGSDHSTFYIEGKLAQRRLLSALALPSWPAPDILTNTVVQLLVDARGLPVSASLLTRSGSKNADQFALDQATAARFNSVVQTGPQRRTNALDGLSLGEIVFEWHTEPLAATNGAPGSP